MKRALTIILMLTCMMAGLSLKAIAYIESTDVVLDEKAGTIYIIGWVYSRMSGVSNKLDGVDAVYSINVMKNTHELFYDGVKLDRLKLSPDYKYISVLKGYESYAKNSEMIILDVKEKKEIISFRDDIRKYIWSPDGNKILYITGENIEGRGLSSTGVWVYDLETKKKKKIAEKAKDVEWLTNNDIYIINYDKKYDPTLYQSKMVYESIIYAYKTETIKSKDVKGVKFSLDGRYSILLTPEYGDITAERDSIKVNFYDVKLNKILPEEKLTNVLSDPQRIEWGDFVWLKGNRILVQKLNMTSADRDLAICDIEKNRVMKLMKGQIVGVSKDRGKVVVFSDEKFAVVNVP